MSDFPDYARHMAEQASERREAEYIKDQTRQCDNDKRVAAAQDAFMAAYARGDDPWPAALAAADAVSGGEDRLTAAEAHRLIVGVTSMDPNANLDEAEDEWERADAKLRRIASGSPASGGEDQHDDERGVPCACLFDTDRQEEPVVECLYHQRLRTAPAPVVGEDREASREGLTVDEWNAGYRTASELLSDVVVERDRLREVLEDLLDRKNDYPTDTSTAFKDAMWSESFDRARAALAGSVSDKDREPER